MNLAAVGLQAEPGSLGGFGALDWAVVGAFLLFTTWLGERLSGRQSSVHDFFLGGRRLPWYAVAASIVATEISAVTLVGLPGVVFREGGDLTYLQLGVVGSFLARWTIALFLVPAYYEREIYSPYDYMGARLGGGVRRVTSALFAFGGVLAQAARVYLIAVVLEVILADELARVEAASGLPSLVTAVGVIGAVAILWTLLGGIATVVWTDAILFVVFLLAIGVALATVVAGLDGGMGEVVRVGGEAGKLRFLDATPTLARPYTIWAALFAVSLGNVAAYGTDQLLAQRLLCCRDVRDARRAIVASYGAMVVTALVALVGVGLYVWYQAHPLEGRALELVSEKPDRVFPVFVVTEVPAGLRGLILAGAFAAAISSLDSILAALSQTTLSTWVAPWRERRGRPLDDRGALSLSRALVVAYGLGLAALAVGCEALERKYPSILDLALALAGYTQGALLAGFLLAFLPLRVDGRGFVVAAPLSLLAVFAVAWSSSDAWRRLADPAASWSAWIVLAGLAALSVAWVRSPAAARERGDGSTAAPPSAPGAVEVRAAVGAPVVGAALRHASFVLALAAVAALHAADLRVAWPWYAPIGCAFALGCGYLWARRSDRPPPSKEIA